MDQHPVPQPISSYEFRLIGSMTLKQFAKLGGCVMAALIIYAIPLPGFLKWPLVVFFALLGLGMAFLPINERPLDTWIVAFFKAVFSPTQYFWQRKPPVLPTATSHQLPVTNSQISPVTSGQSPITTPQPPVTNHQPPITSHQSPITNLDTQEQEFLKNLQKNFSAEPGKPTKIIIEPPEKQTKEEAVAAKISQGDFIFAPTQPNIIYGVIKDKEGKFIDGVIMEIRDSHENVVRALRSNKLGQFRIATSLPNGVFEIDPEKGGFDFDIIKIDLKGEVLPPIEINPK